MVLAIGGFDEFRNPVAATGAEAIAAVLQLPSGKSSGVPDMVPLEVRARPHGGFEAAAVITQACDFQVRSGFIREATGICKQQGGTIRWWQQHDRILPSVLICRWVFRHGRR